MEITWERKRDRDGQLIKEKDKENEKGSNRSNGSNAIGRERKRRAEAGDLEPEAARGRVEISETVTEHFDFHGRPLGGGGTVR